MCIRDSIILQEDIWLGFNAVILGGATIEKGCIVAAGAVVSVSYTHLTLPTSDLV